VLGVFLALCSAATFALNNTFARRGVLTGSAVQALSISVPLGLPMFLLGALAMSSLHWLLDFSWRAYGFLALSGIVHFVWGRYFNYRAVKAIGSNLAGPLQESSVLIALALAKMRPELHVVLIEQGQSFGGNHIWSYFASDILPEHRWLTAPKLNLVSSA
jgi:drug/metabolite transporter (DMT)-like permease